MAAKFFLFMLIAMPAWARTALIYEKSNERKTPLFRFELKTLKQEGSRRQDEGLYSDMKGKVLVKESIVYENEKLKYYAAEYTQFSAVDSVEVKEGKAYFKRVNDGVTKSDVDDVDGELLAGPQIEIFVQKNWAALQEGKTLRFVFAAVGRGAAVAFKIKKERELEYMGKRAVELKMFPGNFFFAMGAGGGVRLIFAQDGKHEILAYIGRTMPRKDEGGRLSEVDAEIVYQ